MLLENGCRGTPLRSASAVTFNGEAQLEPQRLLKTGSTTRCGDIESPLEFAPLEHGAGAAHSSLKELGSISGNGTSPLQHEMMRLLQCHLLTCHPPGLCGEEALCCPGEAGRAVGRCWHVAQGAGTKLSASHKRHSCGDKPSLSSSSQWVREDEEKDG
ncbi:hypothetical protein HPB50_028154 [Hyalomma asiaticum]|nr:hypothetical protein HPB50_028154 [Hyalomma asiaticum]